MTQFLTTEKETRMHSRRMRRLVVGALAAAALAISMSGCASVELSPPLGSCHDYRINSSYGVFSIQQKAKGYSIAWGAYPNATYSGTWYKASIYTGAIKYDGKSQNYPPHGSVNAATAGRYTGQILKISGTVTKDNKTVLVYNMQCRIM